MTEHDDYHDTKIYSQKEMDHTIATLTAEREKVRELVEAVQKAVAAWESHNFDGTPEAVAMERAMGRCEDIIRQGHRSTALTK